jgi:NTE family protein
MLLELASREVFPDLVFGTSVGAINAAWVAGHPGALGAKELADVWLRMRRETVFPARPLAGLRGFMGRANHLVAADGMRSVIRDYLNYSRLEDATLPIKVVATEITSGLEVVLDRGDAQDAVAASASLPGIFPPVMVDGRPLVDGAVANNTPISLAVKAGATEIYVLPTGYACALKEPPRGALAVVLQSITLLIQKRLLADVAAYQERLALHVLPPLCPQTVSPVDFSHTADIIERSRAKVAHWFDAPRPTDQTRLLAMHRHDPHTGQIVEIDHPG